VLNSVQLAELRAELQRDPELAIRLPREPGQVADRLNAQTVTMARSRFVSARTVLHECGVLGALALDELEQFGHGSQPGESNEIRGLRSVVRWAMRFMTAVGTGGEDGVDIGAASTRAMIEATRDVGVISSEQATVLTNLALQPASRAEQLFGEGVTVTEADIRAARNLP
jgi:hypothetical protein